MNGPIVVGTDGTVHSDEALRFAAREAQLRGVELIVVLGYFGPIDPDVDDFETPKPIRMRRHETEAIGAMVRALDVPRSALPPHRVVCDELEPSALLMRAGLGSGAEMIVIGQHYRHLLDRLIHAPSRASRLARRSHVPVLLVPEPDPTGPRGLGDDQATATKH